MTQHIKNILIILLLICYACKDNNISKNAEKKATAITAITSEQLVAIEFIFYKAFIFCDNDIGYFTVQEANNLYKNKIIAIDGNDEIKINKPANYTDDKFKCIAQNLNISEIVTLKNFKTKENFPFDTYILINDKYVIISRDGYFFVFVNQNINKEVKITTNVNLFNDFMSLFNQKLTGLSIVNNKVTDIYKKFELDTNTICMCDSPSLYIDKNSNKLVVFNYCDSDQSLLDIKNKTILSIISIEYKSNRVTLFLENNIKIIFIKYGQSCIYEIKVDGDFPHEYVGNDMKTFFTYEPDNFLKADCGDFGG